MVALFFSLGSSVVFFFNSFSISFIQCCNLGPLKMHAALSSGKGEG